MPIGTLSFHEHFEVLWDIEFDYEPKEKAIADYRRDVYYPGCEETVTVTQIGLVSDSGDGELVLNQDQFNAVMGQIGDQITEACIEHAHYFGYAGRYRMQQTM
ncbi:MAG: hypothetical protein GY841_15915 [FCB group bacterium]|nr:hypothetical protein [FCB group bacterium]